MNEISTKELQEDLSAREGITTFVVAPYQEFTLMIGDETHSGVGPCVISVNAD